MLRNCLFVLLTWCFIDIQLAEPARSLSQRRTSCPIPHNFPHGRVRARRLFVQFICYSPYILVGEKYSSCKNNKWDNPVPICVRPGCEVNTIQNGFTVTSHQDALLTVFCYPKYKLLGSNVLYCDGTRWNTTYPSCVPEEENVAPLSCDFEDPHICGWMQDEEHDFDWRRWNDKTPSSFLFTGPSYDHTLGKNEHGHYMYVESTSRMVNDTARLISPAYGVDVGKDACFQFFYHMFGKTTGGLRVYQKPINVTVQQMLNFTGADKQEYLLFEKWGNLGNVWYSDVLTLTDFGVPFQIVMEGVRGDSFTSDLAFDDVAILKGANCTTAKEHIIMPPKQAVSMESCVGRCEVDIAASVCDCSPECVNYLNCCSDYYDICFAASDSSDYYSGSTEPEVKSVKPTQPDTTTSSTSTTVSPSTVTTTRKSPSTTTPSTTTIKQIIVTTKQTSSTTPSTPTTARGFISRTVTSSSINISTTVTPYEEMLTTRKSEIYRDAVKATKEKEIEERFGDVTKENAEKTANVIVVKEAGGSALKTCIILLVTALCICVCVVAVLRWRHQGRLIIPGRFSNDPEVRYLTTDVDE